MSNNDNIEQKFRDAFDSESISNQGWNDPSDAVWDGIRSDLSKKEKTRFGYGFFILITCLLLSSLCIGYLINQNMNLTRQLNDGRIALDNLNADISRLNQNILQNTDNSSISKNSTTPSEIIDYELINHSRKENKQNSITHFDTNNSEQSYTSIAMDKNYVKEPPVSNDHLKWNNKEAATDKIHASKNHSTATGKRPNRLLKISPIESRLQIVDPYERINIPYINIIEPPKAQTSKSLLTISGGIANNMLLTSGKLATPASELIDREYANLSSIFDIKYTKALSDKWSFSAGLGVSHNSYVSEYDISLPYMTNEEIIENGVGHIDFEHSLPTSFGNTDTQLTLLRSSTNTPLNENTVEIDFNTQHTFLSIQAPISVGYLFKDISSGFFIGLDMIPSYIVSAKSGISSVVSKHSDIQSVNNTSTSDYTSLQRFNVAMGGHIGYRIPVSQRSGIALSSRYTRYINSHFTDGNFNSHSHGVQYSAGYFFIF